MRTTVLSFIALLLCAGVGAGMAQAASNKVAVCHMTNSSSNPKIIINVDDNSVIAHLAHGDSLWSSLTGCSGDVSPE